MNEGKRKNIRTRPDAVIPPPRPCRQVHRRRVPSPRRCRRHPRRARVSSINSSPSLASSSLLDLGMRFPRCSRSPSPAPIQILVERLGSDVLIGDTRNQRRLLLHRGTRAAAWADDPDRERHRTQDIRSLRGEGHRNEHRRCGTCASFPTQVSPPIVLRSKRVAYGIANCHVWFR